MPTLRSLSLLLGLLLCWGLSGQPVQAATVVGNGTPASCTEAALRQAIQAGGTITFNCGSAPVTIILSAELLVSKATELDGGGNERGGLITLSGGGQTRILRTSNGASLTIRNLTLVDGRGSGDDGRAGAIRGGWRSNLTVINSVLRNNDGTAGGQEAGGGAIFAHEAVLLVEQSSFIGNRGINGGAINNLLGSLTVTGSYFEANDATAGGPLQHGYGGAIYIDGASRSTTDAEGGTITIRDTSFVNNRGAGQGGAVFSFVYPPDTVLIERVTFAQNRIEENAKCYANGTCDSLGGGLRHGNGDLILRDSLFVGNLARGQGGAFWAGERGTIRLTNVTFTENRAVHNAVTGEGGLGGALAGGSSWECINCSFVNNHAGFVGGAIFGGDLNNSRLQNSIFVGNSAFNNGRGWNKQQTCANRVGDGGGNVQDPPRNPNDATDVNCVAAPLLANARVLALGDYGGATHTIPLAEGSPAFGAGQNCPATDQRGVARPASGCDSGAYQRGSEPFVRTVLPLRVARHQDQMLTVYGADFARTSVVLWNEQALATTWTSPFELRAYLPATAIGPASTGLVRVQSGALLSPQTVPVQVSEMLYRVYLPITRR